MFGRDSLSGVVFSGIVLIVSMVSVSVMVSGLGMLLYGIWAILLTIGSWQNLARLGFSVALTRFVAEQGRSRQTAHDYLSIIIVVSILLTVLSLTAALNASFVINNIFDIPDEHQQESVAVFYLLLLSSSFGIFSNIGLSVLSGLDKIYLKNSIDLWFSLLNRSLLLLAVCIYGGLFQLGVVVFLVALCKFIVVGWHAFRRIGIHNFNGYDFTIFKESLRKQIQFTTEVYFSSLINFFNVPFYKIFIARAFGVENTAVFEVGVQIRDSVIMILNKLFHPLYPFFARSEKTLRENILSEVSQGVAVLLMPVLIFGFFIAEPFSKVWLGTGYAELLGDAVLYIGVSAGLHLFVLPFLQYFLGRGMSYIYLKYYLVFTIFSVSGLVICYMMGIGIYSVFVGVVAGNLFGSGFLLGVVQRYKLVNKCNMVSVFSKFPSYIVFGVIFYCAFIVINNDVYRIIFSFIYFGLYLTYLYQKERELRNFLRLFRLKR